MKGTRRSIVLWILLTVSFALGYSLYPRPVQAQECRPGCVTIPTKAVDGHYFNLCDCSGKSAAPPPPPTVNPPPAVTYKEGTAAETTRYCCNIGGFLSRRQADGTNIEDRVYCAGATIVPCDQLSPTVTGDDGGVRLLPASATIIAGTLLPGEVVPPLNTVNVFDDAQEAIDYVRSEMLKVGNGIQYGVERAWAAGPALGLAALGIKFLVPAASGLGLVAATAGSGVLLGVGLINLGTFVKAYNEGFENGYPPVKESGCHPPFGMSQWCAVQICSAQRDGCLTQLCEGFAGTWKQNWKEAHGYYGLFGGLKQFSDGYGGCG